MSYSYDFSFGAQKGWQCPICGAVYSPFMTTCLNCAGKSKTFTVSNTSTSTDKTNGQCPFYKGVCGINERYVCYASSSPNGCSIYEDYMNNKRGEETQNGK